MGNTVRIWQLGERESMADWERVLAAGLWRDGELVKSDDRGREVWKAKPLGWWVVVKVRPLRGTLDRLRFRLGKTDLGRAVLGSALLKARSIDLPGVRVLALVRIDNKWNEVLVTDWAAGESMIHRWCKSDSIGRAKIARSAGELIGGLSAKGLFNRDCKPSNIIVYAESLVLIDVGGVRLAGSDKIRELARMVSTLGFEPTGLGARPSFGEVVIGVRSALGAAGVQPAQRRGVLEIVRGLAEAHGDPTPKDNPVAQADEMR